METRAGVLLVLRDVGAAERSVVVNRAAAGQLSFSEYVEVEDSVISVHASTLQLITAAMQKQEEASRATRRVLSAIAQDIGTPPKLERLTVASKTALASPCEEAPPTEARTPFLVGARVRAKAGTYAGRCGVVNKLAAPPCPDVYVTFDLQGREKKVRRELTRVDWLELAEPAIGAAVDEPTCRVCGCMKEHRCDAGAGRHCSMMPDDQKICSVCADLQEACVEELEGGARSFDDVVDAVERACDLDGVTKARVRRALTDRIEGAVAPRLEELPGGRIAIQESLLIEKAS